MKREWLPWDQYRAQSQAGNITSGWQILFLLWFRLYWSVSVLVFLVSGHDSQASTFRKKTLGPALVTRKSISVKSLKICRISDPSDHNMELWFRVLIIFDKRKKKSNWKICNILKVQVTMYQVSLNVLQINCDFMCTLSLKGLSHGILSYFEHRKNYR